MSSPTCSTTSVSLPSICVTYSRAAAALKLPAATTARKIATLRSFYKWAHRQGYAKTNPMTLIRTPRQSKRLPKAITVEQIEQLLAAPGEKDVLGRRITCDPSRRR